jgi:glutamate--cysteine ligase
MISTDPLLLSHLSLPTTEPLSLLEKHLLGNAEKIEAWLEAAFQKTPPPWHCSIDLRRTHYKMAAVDTNLFPAGFNNLDPSFYPHCERILKKTLNRLMPETEKILLIPENHTRNTFYFQSLFVLMQLLKGAGYDTRLGSLVETEIKEIPLSNGENLILYPIQRCENQLKLEDFIPHSILLNNDLSAGIPALLKNVTQAIYPPSKLGWHQRLKSIHFLQYEKVCEALAKHIDLDFWLISPYFRNCGAVDFMQKTGQTCMKNHVHDLLESIRYKYKKYHIDKPPFVFIKADAGTYGMGVMRVTHIEELENINRKQRAHMAKSKDNQQITKVIIQEGIYTDEHWPRQNNTSSTAESVIYLLGKFVAGAFYRIHPERGIDENLNSPGMHFEPLKYANPLTHTPNRFYAYSVIARLATLAAAQEIATLKEEEAQ